MRSSAASLLRMVMTMLGRRFVQQVGRCARRRLLGRASIAAAAKCTHLKPKRETGAIMNTVPTRQPFSFVTSFRNRITEATVVVSVALPQRMLDEASNSVWRCNFSVARDGKSNEGFACSDEAISAVLLAFAFATRELIEGEQEWETADGVPAWLIIPKTVPVSWGFEYYSKIWNLMKIELQKLQRDIEDRRIGRDSPP